MRIERECLGSIYGVQGVISVSTRNFRFREDFTLLSMEKDV